MRLNRPRRYMLSSFCICSDAMRRIKSVQFFHINSEMWYARIASEGFCADLCRTSQGYVSAGSSRNVTSKTFLRAPVQFMQALRTWSKD